MCMKLYYFCYSDKFEATNNTVELRLHLAPSYRLENGALQPSNKELNGSTALSFDRRKTVGDLRLTIYQVTLLPNSPTTVYRSFWGIIATRCFAECETRSSYVLRLDSETSGFVCSDAGILGRRYGFDRGQEPSSRSTPLQYSSR